MEAQSYTAMTEKGDQKIIKAVKEYGSRLFSFIRGRVRSEEDAEDIMQDVWYQLSHNVHVEEIEQLSGWLYKVARNRIIDKSRKKEESHLDDLTYEEDEDPLDTLSLLLPDYSDPELEYMREAFWIALFSALDELPKNQRQVFIWNELENMTLQEIADKTGENLKTIISRKGYAVKFLRKRLESLYDEFINY